MIQKENNTISTKIAIDSVVVTDHIRMFCNIIIAREFKCYSCITNTMLLIQ